MKPLYQTTIVLGPKARGLVSEAQIKKFRVFADRIRIGKQETEFTQMASRRFDEDGCIHYWNGIKSIRLGAQGFQSKGRNDPELSRLLNLLLDFLASENLEKADDVVSHLKYVRTMFHLRHFIHVVALIAYVVAVMVLFANIPVLPWMTEQHPVLTIITGLIGIGVLSHLTANAIIRQIVKKTKQAEC